MPMRRTEYKVEVNIPWASTENSWKGMSTVGGEDEAYSKIPLIYRAIQLRVSSLTRVPVYVYEGETVVSKTKAGDGFLFENTNLTPLYKCSLRNLLELSEVAMLLKGAAFNLRPRNRFGFQKGLQWLNPFTIQVQYRRNDAGQSVPYFWQQIPGGGRFPSEGYWTIDDFLYFREFNPGDDLGMGISATAVALGDSRIIGSVTNFLGNFFTYDALPVTMISSKGMGEGEAKRIEDWFKDKLRGLRNSVYRVIGVNAEDVKIERMTAELKTFDFVSVDAHAVQGVSDAFGMAQSILRSQSGANKAISDNERESYLNDTIIPRCNYYETRINEYLAEVAENLGEPEQHIQFAPDELPEMQVDETNRADALGKLVTAGFDLLDAADTLGYDLTEEIRARLEEKQKAAIEKAKNPQPLPQQFQPGQPPDQQNQDQQDQQVKADLDKWMRKAVSSFKAGKGADVAFETTVIPAELKAEIETRLKNGESKSEEGIREIFALKLGSRHSQADMALIGEAHDLADKIKGNMVQLGHGAKKPISWREKQIAQKS
jgi:hypothetical protein